MLEYFTAIDSIQLGGDFGGDPKHFLVDQLFELLEHRFSVFGVSLEQVVDEFRRLDLGENLEILQRQLKGDFHRVELQERDVGFFEHFGGDFVADELFRVVIGFDVVSSVERNPLRQIVENIRQTGMFDQTAFLHGDLTE